MFSKGSKSSTSEEKPKPVPVPEPPPRVPGAAKGDSVPSIISADLKITGNLESRGDVQIDGRIIGDIKSRSLTVGEYAQVDGSIYAEAVRVCGSISGEVRADQVVLDKTAKVEGDIVHKSLAIEAGAYIEGNIRRLDEQSDDDVKVTVLKSGQGQGDPGAS